LFNLNLIYIRGLSFRVEDFWGELLLKSSD